MPVPIGSGGIRVKRRRGYIVWTVYFDAEKSWSEGRRVPRRLAVEKPRLDEVAEAARRAGYKVVVEPDKRYPAWWFEEGGRVVVEAEGEKKREVLYRIGGELVNIRRSSPRKKRR